MSSHDEGWKELRVRIEPAFYQKLLALKILGHKTMTEAIHEALVHYFADVLPDAPRTAPTSRQRPAAQADEPVESAR